MREIKFRGKCIPEFPHPVAKWVYGAFVSDKLILSPYKERNENRYSWYMVDPATVGQFTGVRDWNKTEIYEGDILRKRDEFALRTANTGAVFWNREECRWCVWVRGGLVFSLTMRKGETWSVIGNMYDNPELLEERKP